MSLAVEHPFSLRHSARSVPRAVLPARVLPTAHIRLDAELHTLEALFEEVAQIIAGTDRPKPEHVVRALVRRHALSSPSLGSGLALARAAVPKIGRPLAAYVRVRQPFRLLANDEYRVTDCLVLLVPRPGFLADHDLLMRVTAFLSEPGSVSALRACTDEAAIRYVLTGQE